MDNGNNNNNRNNNGNTNMNGGRRGRRGRRGTRKNMMGGQNNMAGPNTMTKPMMGGQNNMMRATSTMMGGQNNMRNMTTTQMGGALRAVGSHAEVWHGTARHTSGGLKKKDLMKNKHGRIISRRKHALGKKALKNLVKAGFKAKKGTFKLFRK